MDDDININDLPDNGISDEAAKDFELFINRMNRLPEHDAKIVWNLFHRFICILQR